MKNKFFITILIFSLVSGSAIFAQETGKELILSLKQAQDYALQNNKMVKSAKLTVESSNQDVWTTISSGLPNISASASYQDNLKLGVFVMTMNGTTMVIQMGRPYNIPVSVQASMPLFNAPYYVGIETVKLAKKLSESSLQNTEIDTRQSVATA
jgi:outer membrane protein TolC